MSQGTLIMGADVNERKLVEKLLWRQARLMDQVHDAVISADLNGYIAGWNQSAERLLGHTAAALLGKSLTFLYRSCRYE